MMTVKSTCHCEVEFSIGSGLARVVKRDGGEGVSAPSNPLARANG
jgi:hypothetical protein